MGNSGVYNIYETVAEKKLINKISWSLSEDSDISIQSLQKSSRAADDLLVHLFVICCPATRGHVRHSRNPSHKPMLIIIHTDH